MSADEGPDWDVVVVGGGPAGCSAAVFAARDGLDTLVCDRGRSSLARCAHLANYLGFPAGLDVETLSALFHDHVEASGGVVRPALVESVARRVEGGFAVETQDGEELTTARVVAATRYGADYLQPLDDGGMFESHEHEGETEQFLDRKYAEEDGTTPIDGLYVASPATPADEQAVMAAGRGARVGRRVVADARVDDGWWEPVAADLDWARREAELSGNWADRERWVEWFDDRFAESAPVERGSARYERVRAAAIDRRFGAYLDTEEMAARRRSGHEALAARLDPAAVVAAHDDAALLDAMDDESVREHLESDTESH